MAYHVSNVEGMNLENSDSKDTNYNMLMTSVYMARTYNTSIDSPEDTCHLVNPHDLFLPSCPNDDIEVRAHFEYIKHPKLIDKLYTKSDREADFCNCGMYAKVILYTRR